MKGNVYFDDKAVCDDDWGHEEAKVACRWVCLFFSPKIHTLTKTMAKKTVQNCDERAVSHSFDVFFRMLGYNHGFPEVKSAYGPAKRGERFWRAHLQCQGDEESLEDCGGKENPSCARGEVAGVTCYLGGIVNEHCS